MAFTTDTVNEFYSDDWYNYYLTLHSNNETLAAIAIAKIILSKFTSNTRAKLDQLEVHDNQQFEQYLKWLNDFINNPAISGLRSPVPYCGGISASDMRDNNLVTDNNTVPVKTGSISGGCETLTNNYTQLIKDC
jgi:hypothetical protein